MKKFWNDVSTILTDYYEAFVLIFPRLVLALLVLFFFLFTAQYLNRILKKKLINEMDDILLAHFITRTVKIFYHLLGLMIILSILDLTGFAGSLLAGAGLSAIIVGFAFKDIAENFLAGVIMAFRRPFRKGDIIQSGDVQGTVLQLNIRDTQVKTFDGKDVFIPNGQILKNALFNYTIDGYLRYDFTIGLDYGSDVTKAIEIIHQTLAQVKGILTEEKKPTVMVKELNTSTIDLSVFFWIGDFSPNTSIARVKTEAMIGCVRALEAAGFYLPGNVLELKNYNDSKLETL
jgi:small-conductance mechanosensitive channel